MDRGWVSRMRWRRRGAWLWPAFIALTALDAVAVHALPVQGDSQSLAGAAIIALALNLIGVVVVSPAAGALLRRVRRDLPSVVARDYAGTAVVALVTAALLTAGLLHHSSVRADRRAMDDAITRAVAYIGDRAPAEFRRNLQHQSTYTIEARRIYRTCVWSAARPRSYCVVVKPGSVTFAGSEPNATFAAGTR
jgi:hypothetical protein